MPPQPPHAPLQTPEPAPPVSASPSAAPGAPDRPAAAALPGAAPRPSVTDQVHDSLFRDIMTARLPPGHKLSEADLSRGLGVSRQPVRDALFRLSTQGLVVIRPQRATQVAPISPQAVQRARFIRAAIEGECVRLACAVLDAAACDALDALVDAQRAAIAAGDDARFHALDDAFHRSICEGAGQGFAWDMIHAMKAQMDRVRYLSIRFASAHACADHARVAAAIRARDAGAAQTALREHIQRIDAQMHRLQASHPAHFAPDAA